MWEISCLYINRMSLFTYHLSFLFTWQYTLEIPVSRYVYSSSSVLSFLLLCVHAHVCVCACTILHKWDDMLQARSETTGAWRSLHSSLGGIEAAGLPPLPPRYPQFILHTPTHSLLRWCVCVFPVSFLSCHLRSLSANSMLLSAEAPWPRLKSKLRHLFWRILHCV